LSEALRCENEKEEAGKESVDADDEARQHRNGYRKDRLEKLRKVRS